MTNVDLSTYVDATADPMIVVSDDGRIAAANRPARDTLGMQVGSLFDYYCHDASEAQRLSGEFRGTTSECIRKLRLEDGNTVMITGRRLGQNMRHANLVSIRFDARTRLASAFMSLTLRLQENRRRLRELEEERQWLRAENESLTHRAFHDGLTGLLNRAGFEERLSTLDSESTPDAPSDYAILFLDLDGLKSVNDRFGHAAGDEMLKRFGRIIAGAVRRSDVAARLGGDEFAIMLDGAQTRDEVCHVTDRIASQLSFPMPFHLKDRKEPQFVAQSVSIGVVLRSEVSGPPLELLELADRAMYHIKARGGGVCFHESGPELRAAN
ncbi:sensor domain-containing diguanylate cyclase [Litorivita sp. NS0012-18]|uniref:GGDEF domain-containing protein n=1 Tax=Litorivita sp. NS0012-18 TaxID=3127655 RepID=UPI00310907E9